MISVLPAVTLPGVPIEILRARCATCSMHQLCLPMGLDLADMDRLDQIIGRRRKVVRGATLFRIGDPFVSLYAIRLGHFKTYQINIDGEEQVTGFQMGGE
jgi:CRP/FNR family transcriptional regulator